MKLTSTLSINNDVVPYVDEVCTQTNATLSKEGKKSAATRGEKEAAVAEQRSAMVEESGSRQGGKSRSTTEERV